LKIVHYPEKILRRPTERIGRPDSQTKELVRRMFEIMYSSGGVGLSANQIGLSLRLAVVNPTGKKEDEMVLINPEIIRSEGRDVLEEGCLSCPGVKAPIARKERIVVRFVDLDGREHEEEYTGFLARIIQHELDHLDGRLIIDRMDPVARIINKRILRSLEKANREEA